MKVVLLSSSALLTRAVLVTPGSPVKLNEEDNLDLFCGGGVRFLFVFVLHVSGFQSKLASNRVCCY